MREDEFDPLLYAPAVPLFELVLQNAQAVEERLGRVLRDLQRDVVVGTDQRAEVTEPIRHHVEHGAGVGKRHILLEARHANTRLQPDGSPIGHLLARPGLQWLGTHSYALYLWHWPVMVFAAAQAGPLRWHQAVVAIGISLGLAALMATGLLYDVHGNLPALEAVLNDAAHQDVDRWVLAPAD